MAYDPATRQLVFVGAATWVLRDSKWREVSSEQPNLTNIVFDPLGDRLLGGSVGTSSMWWWNGQASQRAIKKPPMFGWEPDLLPSEGANWVTDAAEDEVFVLGAWGNTQSGNAVNACTWNGDNFLPIFTPSTPAMDNPQNFSLGYDPNLRVVVAFGGNEGVAMPSGVLITGGSQTWLLTRG